MTGSRWRAFGFVVLLAGAAASFVHYLHRCGDVRARTGPVTLNTAHARIVLHRDGRFVFTSADGARSVDGTIVVDEGEGTRPLELVDLTESGASDARASVVVHPGDPPSALAIHADAAADAIDLALAAPPPAAGEPAEGGDEEGESRTPNVGLRFALDGRGVFLAGRGELADLASDDGRLAVVGDAVHPVGIVADGKDMHVELAPSPEDARAIALTATVPCPAAGAVPAAETHVSILMGAPGGLVYKHLFDRAGVKTKRVAGRVTGLSHAPEARAVAQVIGLDEDGAPQVRASTDVAGRFEVEAPEDVKYWFASASATRTSAPVLFTPGTGWELKLDVSDGGELHVRVKDADTHAPLTARLVVHGIDGTLDPSFGPDYRASGAGPIIDALRGEITTPLPAGKYRVAATRGIEWSIDARVVSIEPGKRVDVDLAPRHVVPTPGEIGCDLHVHARPSFDSPVSADDRVLSLVAAGVDFAVPTEHNLVGDYASSLEVLGLAHELAWASGVEVTTYTPRFGHFGVFPYPVGRPVPPFRHATVDQVFAAARAGDPKRVLVVHHPRLSKDIGYFNAFGYKAGGPVPIAMRTDFDALEVYNGYEAATTARVDAVLADYYALLNAGHRYTATGSSDSHRIQYQWAGYPRTMVRIGDADPEDKTLDPLAIVAAIKAGHATVTSGPIIELELEGVRPGSELIATQETVHGHLVVRAAPWIDVTSATLVVRGVASQTFDVPTRAMLTGPEEGPLEEAQARTVRLDTQVGLDVGAEPTWVMVVVRGTRPMDDILPFMPIAPLAFTNPIYIRR